MTKKNLLILLCFVLCLSCVSLNVVNANKNNVLKKAKLERVTIKSDLLKKNMNVIVYLPKGYGDGRQYPVLYFIHGFDKDGNLLTEVGFDQKATALIEAERINPLIIVAPQMDNSWIAFFMVCISNPGVQNGTGPYRYSRFKRPNQLKYIP